MKHAGVFMFMCEVKSILNFVFKHDVQISQVRKKQLGKNGQRWGFLVEAFEQSELVTLHPTTRADYLAAIRKHTLDWWQTQATLVTRVQIKELLATLEAQGYSSGHLNKVKIVINRIFVFGIEHRLIGGLEQSPTQGIQIKKSEETKPEILTIGEIQTLLSSAKKLGSPWYPIWAMALLTGMRNGELYALKWQDVSLENQSITVCHSYNSRQKCEKSTKAGYWRSIPISRELSRLLRGLRVQSKDTLHVLPRLWRWEKGMQAQELRKFCIGLGIPSIRFHALRACFATQLIRSGVPPIQIQKICGWRDLKTMQRYIRLSAIEITGVTEVLKLLPDQEVSEKASELFGEPVHEPKANEPT